MASFNNNSFQQPPTFQQSQSSSSEVFNVNALGLPTHYGSSPNLATQVQTYSYPAQACSSNALDVNDPNLQQQVEQIIASLSEQKRPMLRRQVITVPAQNPGRVACITRRLATPAPDIIERITVIKPPRDIVNLCIEKPTQPEPCFQSREICGKQRKPLIQPRIVSVAPRSNPCCPPQPQLSPCQLLAQQQQQQQLQQQQMQQQQQYQQQQRQPTYSQAPQAQQYAPQHYAQQPQQQPQYAQQHYVQQQQPQYGSQHFQPQYQNWQ